MLLALALLGCPKDPSVTPAVAGSAATIPQGTAGILSQRVTGEGLTEVQVDLDGDSKAEIINYYRTDGSTKLLLKKDVDLNRDGRIDVRSSFDESGLRVSEEMDGDFDGRADWVDRYVQGKRAMSEVDTDFNGTFDLFKYYENGRVRRKERDSNADGRVDFWEYLDEAGAVVKTGRDIDNDGKMDERTQ